MIPPRSRRFQSCTTKRSNSKNMTVEGSEELWPPVFQGSRPSSFPVFLQLVKTATIWGELSCVAAACYFTHHFKTKPKKQRRQAAAALTYQRGWLCRNKPHQGLVLRVSRLLGSSDLLDSSLVLDWLSHFDHLQPTGSPEAVGSKVKGTYTTAMLFKVLTLKYYLNGVRAFLVVKLSWVKLSFCFLKRCNLFKGSVALFHLFSTQSCSVKVDLAQGADWCSNTRHGCFSVSSPSLFLRSVPCFHDDVFSMRI